MILLENLLFYVNEAIKGADECTHDAPVESLRTSRDDAKPIVDELSTLFERVEGLAHVMKQGDGDAIKSVHKLLDLVENGNGLRQLQVWSRFAWLFGRADADKADHCLTKLLEFATIRKQNADLLKTLPKWSLRARAKALRYALQAAQHCEILLDHLNDNEREAQAIEREHKALYEQAARSAQQ